MIWSTRYARLGSISYAMHGSTNSIARQVATVASRLRFDALPPHALRTSLRMLHFTLSPEDCKGEVKLLMCCAMIGSISYAMHGSTNSIARQVATVASRLRFDASSATCFAHKPLNASLRSFVGGLQGRSQAVDALRNDWKYPLRNAWEYKLRNA